MLVDITATHPAEQLVGNWVGRERSKTSGWEVATEGSK